MSLFDYLSDFVAANGTLAALGVGIVAFVVCALGAISSHWPEEGKTGRKPSSGEVVGGESLGDAGGADDT